MARKIGVIQRNSGSPKTYIKKAVAALLVRRHLAVWVIQNLTVQMLPAKLKTQRDTMIESSYHPCKPFIPEHLPPNIDQQLGLIAQFPVLNNQIRFRPI